MKKFLMLIFLYSAPLFSTTPHIEGYWESSYQDHPIDITVHMEIDTIVVAYGTFQPISSFANGVFDVRGVECEDEELHKLVTLAREAHKCVKLSIGGSSYPLAGMLRTKEDAIGMAAALSAYCFRFNLDGVNFDIEDNPSSELQYDLVQATRHLLGEGASISYTISTAAPPPCSLIQTLHPYVDTIILMTYSTSLLGETSKLIEQGVPAEKIMIGLIQDVVCPEEITPQSDLVRAADYVLKNRLRGLVIWDVRRDLESLTALL